MLILYIVLGVMFLPFLIHGTLIVLYMIVSGIEDFLKYLIE
jgi:hypothetical protein